MTMMTVGGGKKFHTFDVKVRDSLIKDSGS